MIPAFTSTRPSRTGIRDFDVVVLRVAVVGGGGVGGSVVGRATGVDQLSRMPNNMIPAPLKSIRAECLDCCRGSSHEVSLCPATGCPLHSVRFGRRAPDVSPLAAIRAKCIDCSGGFVAEVRRCAFGPDHAQPCSLHPYRLGRNPNRSGIGSLHCSRESPAQLAFQPCEDSGGYVGSGDQERASKGRSAEGSAVRPQGRTRGIANDNISAA